MTDVTVNYSLPPEIQVVVATQPAIALAVAAQGLAGPRGATGPQGVPGVSGASYVYEQMSAASVWNINHGLGRFPSITVVDSGGNEVEGSAEYIDSNNVTLTFTSPFSGTAYLN